MNKNKLFIYVTTESDRDSLLARGYRLLRSDDKNKVYCFENIAGAFDRDKELLSRCVASNTLIF